MADFVDLLEALADGQVHDQGALAGALGIEAAALSTLAGQLHDAGIALEYGPDRGYRLLEHVERLDAATIRRALPGDSAARGFELTVLAQVDSTNAWLAQRAQRLANGSLCLAEQQLAGRGRRSRHWSSPFGRNLYLSMLWRLPAQRLSGLSLAVGVCVAEACEDLGAGPIALKWPNDLLAITAGERCKLGGILIEVNGDARALSTAIIGIGLNVDMPARLRAAIDQPIGDLNALAGERLSRNRLVAQLMARLAQTLPEFEAHGFAPFRERFAARDANLDCAVQVEQGGTVSTGLARGTDASGALMVETRHGLTRIFSGEVSVRAAT